MTGQLKDSEARNTDVHIKQNVIQRDGTRDTVLLDGGFDGPQYHRLPLEGQRQF